MAERIRQYQCSAGTKCKGGTITVRKNGETEPCCIWGDNEGKQKCEAGNIVYKCSSASCFPHEENYASCYKYAPYFYQKQNLKHIFKTFCPDEIVEKLEGDFCQTNEDCRPTAKQYEPQILICDSNTAKCVLSKRPPAPANYFKPCGEIDPNLAWKLPPGEDFVLENIGDQCQYCMVSFVNSAFCLYHACTIPCRYDEDCPEYSSCVCLGEYTADANPRSSLLQYCVLNPINRIVGTHCKSISKDDQKPKLEAGVSPNDSTKDGAISLNEAAKDAMLYDLNKTQNPDGAIKMMERSSGCSCAIGGPDAHMIFSYLSFLCLILLSYISGLTKR